MIDVDHDCTNYNFEIIITVSHHNECSRDLNTIINYHINIRKVVKSVHLLRSQNKAKRESRKK